MNHSRTPAVHEVDALKMMALSDAEQIACRRPGTTVVVYSRKNTPPQGAWTTGDSLPSFTVLPADEPAPEGTTILTTVTRHDCEEPGRAASLGSIVRQVLANLPADVVLADRAIVERYPPRPYHSDPPGIFAYQFLSTEGMNVATWIPDTSIDGALMQMGYEGRGRPWKDAPSPQNSSTSIERYIAHAKRTPLAREVMNWWSDAQNEVDGDRSIFDRTPDFVAGAESGRSDRGIATSIAEWWPDAQSMTYGERGEWKEFDRTPAFVVMAEWIIKLTEEVAPDAEAIAPRRPRPR